MDLNIPPSPISQIPSEAPLTQKHKHKEFFYLAIAVVVVVAGLIWWQINSYSQEQEVFLPTATSTPDADTQEINNINRDMQDADIGDLDAEFQEIDSDLDGL